MLPCWAYNCNYVNSVVHKGGGVPKGTEVKNRFVKRGRGEGGIWDHWVVEKR